MLRLKPLLSPGQGSMAACVHGGSWVTRSTVSQDSSARLTGQRLGEAALGAHLVTDRGHTGLRSQHGD